MAAAVDDFTAWLGDKLQALNTDESVFGSYITGILEGDETLEEKTEALELLFSEIIDNDIASVCKEIIDRWQKSQPKETAVVATGEDVEAKLVRLLESRSLVTTVQREYTDEERKIREAILLQYSQMTDDEGGDSDVEGGGGGGGGGSGESRPNGLERNTNAQAVQQAEKEKREQAKMESQKKKEKDKEDREKQKQVREEKKEKRKTQKGERRR